MEKTDILYEGKFINMAKRGRWEFAQRNNCDGVVSILPFDKNTTQIVLIKEYRELVDKWFLSLPAGLVEKNEPIRFSAARELKEETGYACEPEDLIKITEYYKSPGLTDEMEEIFMTTQLNKISDMIGVDGEQIELVSTSLHTIDATIKKCLQVGISISPNVYIGLHWLKLNFK